MMNNPVYYGKKSPYFLASSFLRPRGCRVLTLIKINSFLLHVLYFIFLSSVGFGIFKATNPRTDFKPRNIDLFFTSVSASTVSSMSTVEMEVFSNGQLILMTILMFVGGEVFTSMVGIFLRRSSKFTKTCGDNVEFGKSDQTITSTSTYNNMRPPAYFDHVVALPESGNVEFESTINKNSSLKQNSIKLLGYLVLAYLLVIQILGVSCVMLYISLVSSARNVLRSKGIKSFTFSVFVVVSTFASCGFVPTNENMIIFRKNSGLLLIIIPQILFGNTLFPSCLRFLIWAFGKRVKNKAAEAVFLLENPAEVGYFHLLPKKHSMFLVATVAGFISVGFVLFSAMGWDSAALNGLSTAERVVGGVFQSANARHTGETIVDLSTIAPAILVLFVFMMYLPPYTSFIPFKSDDEDERIILSKKGRKKGAMKDFIFSQLSYIVIFIILICITERKNMVEDPINFSVLNITLEVVSAYGNVGFTTGYNCKYRIRPDLSCVTKSYGFSGEWSDEGKILLIIVMFLGRLKQFNVSGGRAWKIL